MVYYPPVPSLPPASELRRYGSRPPDMFSPIQHYHDYEKAMDFVYEAYDATSVLQKVSFLRQALAIFPFCADALNEWADIYVNAIVPASLERAEETVKLALAACRLLWPDLEQQSEIPWAQIEHRTFLRTYCFLARVQKDMGKVDDAIEKYQFLLRVNPTDGQRVHLLLFWTLLETGDYKLAEEIAEKYANGRKSIDANICYGYVVVDFLKFRLGVCAEKKVKATLVDALTHNLFLPALLLDDKPLPDKQELYSPGAMDEAIDIAHRIKIAWKKVPGIVKWLREQQHLGGEKPNDDGTILFQLLQKGNVLVKKKNSDHPLRLTTNVGQMPGQLTPEFCLAPGMKEHNPARIVAFDRDKVSGNDDSFLSNFTSFSYDDVAEIPFWNVLDTCKSFGEVKNNCGVCYEQTATLTCSVCKAISYCSRKCQKKDWKKRHKAQCPKFIKT